MKFRPRKWSGLLFAATLTSVGCGVEDNQTNKRGSGDQIDLSDPQQADSVRLARTSTEQVLDSMVIHIDDQGVYLTDSKGWTVDMEARKQIEGQVAAIKYLRVKGDVKIPENAGNETYNVGCLYVELKDNVYYREKTWLRIASTAVRGLTYTDVKVPLDIQIGGWKALPELDDSITLSNFEGNTIKSFDKTLCFRVDLTKAPAQKYRGEVVVQYLRPGKDETPVNCAKNPKHDSCKPCDKDEDVGDGDIDPPMPVFACASKPAVLKAGQAIDLKWHSSVSTEALEIKLATDPANFSGDRGEVESTGTFTARYKAPAKIPVGARILVTAKALGNELLPAFCEVNLVADPDIGVGDDGEINGLTGNVYKVAVNQPKLPDFTTMTPVAKIVAGNLDIPTRAFSAGFPGVKDLFEWFGIRFRGRINVAKDGQYQFRLNSDDGANLYINGKKVIDNDGIHAPAAKDGTIALTAGSHEIMVDYYQGPRYHIALELFWKTPGSNEMKIVPPESFSRPLE